MQIASPKSDVVAVLGRWLVLVWPIAASSAKLGQIWAPQEGWRYWPVGLLGGGC
jgi:hypothetical protein